MAKKSNTNLTLQYKKLSEWTMSQLNSACRGAVIQAAKLLKQNTKLYLIASHPNTLRPNKNWPWTIDNGVLIGKYKKGQAESKVHLMGHRALPGTHRLKWIANGTKDRYNKAGKFLGHINPTPFFETAILHTPIDLIIERACEKAIVRINKKNNY